MGKKEIKIQKFEKELIDASIWQNNPKKAQEISQKISDLKEEIAKWQKFETDFDKFKKEADQLLEMKNKEGDLESIKELQKDLAKQIDKLEKEFKKEELKVFLSGPHDQQNAILSIYAGAGGTEAQDWSEILLRMYLRYAERKRFKAQVLHIHEGQEAGIKNVTLEIRGKYAYGYLKRESGVHRLVRLSPFNANNLRHTSFALIEVLPEIEKQGEIKIKSEDLRVDTYRASGPGGQYVNKTESAVRLTHLPSGIVVACQSERSQGANKERAMKLLYTKLYQKELEKKEKEVQELRSQIQTGEGTAEWGNQIRSYVLHPYKMVKDLRTNIESKEPDKILDGELDEFIEAELRVLTN